MIDTAHISLEQAVEVLRRMDTISKKPERVRGAAQMLTKKLRPVRPGVVTVP